jgi:polyphosphate glucokinase
MTAKRVRVETPYPCRPETLLRVAAEMTKSLPAFDRISIGFPGVIRRGRVVTAPHFGTKRWRGYPLEEALSRRLGKPARLLNDAEVQGLGVIAGRGLEVVMTLGTGVGTAVFADGRLTPHLELAHHPIHKDMTYDDYLGNAALHAHKVRKWSRRVLKAIGFIHTLLNYDTLYIGGGNAAKIRGDLPDNVKICPNSAGITGGVHLWDGDLRI